MGIKTRLYVPEGQFTAVFVALSFVDDIDINTFLDGPRDKFAEIIADCKMQTRARAACTMRKGLFSVFDLSDESFCGELPSPRQSRPSDYRTRLPPPKSSSLDVVDGVCREGNF